MYQVFRSTISGMAPLILHNGQTADKLNKYAKAIDVISHKTKKTDADYAELAWVEYQAGLYMDEQGPVIPAHMVGKIFVEGAKKSKAGRLVQAGIVAEKHASIDYIGPRTAHELFDDSRFRLSVPVVVNGKRVMRTRPIFKMWAAELEIQYLPDVVNEQTLVSALRNAGIYCGLGDWRPQNGRFQLVIDMQRPMAAE